MNQSNTQIERALALLEQYERQLRNVSFMTMGLDGHRFVTDGTYSGDTFCALIAWGGADAQVDYTLVREDGTTITHSNVALKDGGFPIYGTITGLNVDSGTVCAYYGKQSYK